MLPVALETPGSEGPSLAQRRISTIKCSLSTYKSIHLLRYATKLLLIRDFKCATDVPIMTALPPAHPLRATLRRCAHCRVRHHRTHHYAWASPRNCVPATNRRITWYKPNIVPTRGLRLRYKNEISVLVHAPTNNGGYSPLVTVASVSPLPPVTNLNSA